MDVPRRTLLKTTGTALLLGTAGCVTGGSNDSETPTADGDSAIPNDLRSVLETIPASVVADESRIIVAKQDATNDLPMAQYDGMGFSTGESTLSWIVTVNQRSRQRLTVATGDIATDQFSDTNHIEDQGSYSLYRINNKVVAVSPTMVVAHPDKETVGTVLSATDEDSETGLLEGYPSIERSLGKLDGYKSVRFMPGTNLPDDFPVAEDDLNRVAVGTQRLNESTVRTKGVFVMSDNVTLDEEKQTSLKDSLTSSVPTDTSSSFTFEENMAIVAFDRTQHAPPPEDTPRLGRGEYNESANRMEISLRGVGSMSVDNLTLKVDGEPYDPAIWADGKDELSASDTIYIEEDALEPQLQVTLSYEGEDHSGGTSTRLLHRLEFEEAYDMEARELTLTYQHGLELDGDKVYVGLTTENRAEPRAGPPDEQMERTLQPWSGETVSSGTSATIQNVDPGQVIRVGWEGTDHQSQIYSTDAPLPAHVDFEQKGEGVTVRLFPRSDESINTDLFEVRVDGDPVDKTFSTSGDGKQKPLSLTLTEPEPSSTVAVYLGDTQIRETTVLPDAELSMDFEGEGLTLSHDGGDPLDPDKMKLAVMERRHDEISLSEKVSGQFTDGDTVSLDIANASRVVVEYDDEMFENFERPPHPADVNFSYDDGELTLTLDLEQSYPADTFEIRVERETAATQWSDNSETVSDGDSVTLSGLEFGADVSVHVQSRRRPIARTEVKPDVSLSMSLPAENPTLSHDGGASLDASEVKVILLGEDGGTPVSLDEKLSGDFSEGDSITFEVGKVDAAFVQYKSITLYGFHPERETTPVPDGSEAPTETPN